MEGINHNANVIFVMFSKPKCTLHFQIALNNDHLSYLSCIDFSDIPGGEVFACDPDSDGKLDTSVEFFQSMGEGQHKQREAADKYKSDRRAEKKIQKDMYGKFYIFLIIVLE